MVALLATELGIPLEPREVDLGDGVRVKVDGASGDLRVLCEAWAHQGPAKGGQLHKILKDVLKLALVARTLRTSPSPRLILLFSDDAATSKFRTGWAGLAIREFGVEIHVVDLPDELRQSVLEAQRRQYR